MARKSTKALNEFLATLGAPPCTCFETYGKNTRAYVTVPAGMTRSEFESKLYVAGFTADPGWNRDSKTATDVAVTYRKAFGWDK